MVDVEKIKQLMKSCATDDLCDEECPYHGKGCVDAMIRDAVDVIEKQQAKIKKYELDKSWEDSPDRMNGSGW